MTQPTDEIEKTEALSIAQIEIARFSSHDFVLQKERTIECRCGWAFFYAPGDYLRTNDPLQLVPGMAPLIVHRRGGSIVWLPFSIPPLQAIKIHEAECKGLAER